MQEFISNPLYKSSSDENTGFTSRSMSVIVSSMKTVSEKSLDAKLTSDGTDLIMLLSNRSF